MKKKPKANKDDSESDDDEAVDGDGYKDLPTVGVSYLFKN